MMLMEAVPTPPGAGQEIRLRTSTLATKVENNGASFAGFICCLLMILFPESYIQGLDKSILIFHHKACFGCRLPALKRYIPKAASCDKAERLSGYGTK
jgi:hypothetical protein